MDNKKEIAYLVKKARQIWFSNLIYVPFPTSIYFLVVFYPIKCDQAKPIRPQFVQRFLVTNFRTVLFIYFAIKHWVKFAC